MKVGYIRVSAEEQNMIRQEVIMEQLGVERIYMDKAGGKSRDARPGLEAMMDYVRDGDEVIVESISRFARSTKDLLLLVEQLEAKQVEFVSKKESIDTRTPQGRFMLTVFRALAELERETTLQRQKEGIERAKVQGKYKGRKPDGIDRARFAALYEEVKRGERPTVYVQKLLSLSKPKYYRLVNEYENRTGRFEGWST